MAKAPIAGMSKTRLASALGEQGAADLARVLLTDALRLQQEVPKVRPILFFHPWTQRHELLQPVLAEAIGDAPLVVFEQRGQKLAERMHRAFSRVFAYSPRPMVMIGADIPELNVAHITEAFQRLAAGADAVFGPTEDGGYYLIGLRRPHPELLLPVTMSATTTLDETLERGREAGIACEVLSRRLRDLDVADDLRWFVEQQHELDIPGSALKAWLAAQVR